MLQLAIIAFGIFVIVIGVKTMWRKQIMLRREIHGGDGKTIEAKYLRGTAAVVAGLACVVLGCILQILALALSFG